MDNNLGETLTLVGVFFALLINSYIIYKKIFLICFICDIIDIEK